MPSQLEHLAGQREFLVVVPDCTLDEFYALNEAKADYMNGMLVLQSPLIENDPAMQDLLRRHEYMVEIPATLEDFYALEEAKADYYDGTIFMHSPASIQHERCLGSLYVQLYQYVQQHQLGELFGSHTPLHLAEVPERFEPDIFFIARDNPGRYSNTDFVGVPDLVIEVLTPGTRRYDLGYKRQAYHNAGVSELWFYDPEAGELTADRRQAEGSYTTQVQRSGTYEAGVSQALAVAVPLS